MAIDAKLELTLKFTTLPHAKPAGQGKMAFALKTPDGQFVTAEVSNKVWNKLVKTAEDWPSWIAALTGTMGPRTEKGFTLENPGLQVFERKPKAPAEAASPAGEALSAALTAVSPVDVAPAPAVADSAEPVPAFAGNRYRRIRLGQPETGVVAEEPQGHVLNRHPRQDVRVASGLSYRDHKQEEG